MSLVSTVKKYMPEANPLAHVMLWHGGGNPAHKVVPYNSSDFYTMQKQLDILQASGVAGVIVTEKGLANTFVHNNAYELCKLCNALGFLFAILLDPAVATADPKKSKEQNFADFMNDEKTQFMVNSPMYLPEKYILDFNTKIDWTKVSHIDQFSILAEHTDFGWIDTPSDKMKGCKIPIVFWQFFNGGLQKPTALPNVYSTDWNTGVWNNGPTKSFPNMGGKYFNSFLPNLNRLAKYWAFVLNDYDEETAFEPMLSIETGISLAP